MTTYSYPMEPEVQAIYTPARDLRPNPLRDALPPQLTRSDVLKQIQHFPPYSERDRHEPSPDEKFLLLDRIQQVFYPLSYYVDLQRALDRAIRNSYEHRNVLDPRFYRRIVDSAKSIADFKTYAGIAKADCCGFAIGGDSGIGKTSALEHALQLMPRVINHSSFNGKPLPFRQVPWIKVDCPENASTRALIIEMIKAYDDLLDEDYEGLFCRSRRATAKDLTSAIARIACYHGTGIAVVDELQNLALGSSGGGDQVLAFFSNFMHKFGQPIIMVGTIAAVRLLSSRFSQARRATGYSKPVWSRLERNDPDWTVLLQALWKYQYTEVDTPLDSNLSDAMHKCTQGIADSAAKLYKSVQELLIYRKKDKQVITPELIEKTADKLFGLQAQHLRMISGASSPKPKRERAGDNPGEDYLLPAEMARIKELQQRQGSTAVRSADPKVTTVSPTESPGINATKPRKTEKPRKQKPTPKVTLPVKTLAEQAEKCGTSLSAALLAAGFGVSTRELL